MALAAIGITATTQIMAEARQWIQDALMIRVDADIDVIVTRFVSRG